MGQARDKEVTAVLVAWTTGQVELKGRYLVVNIEAKMRLAHQLFGGINPKVLLGMHRHHQGLWWEPKINAKISHQTGLEEYKQQSSIEI